MNNHHLFHQKKIPLTFILLLFSLALFFLPGPNGLISILSKIYRIRQYRSQISRLKARADSLEKELKLWHNPDYAAEFARRLFRHLPTDSVK